MIKFDPSVSRLTSPLNRGDKDETGNEVFFSRPLIRGRGPIYRRGGKGVRRND